MKIELIGTDKEIAGLHTIHFAFTAGEAGPENFTVTFVDGLAECDDNHGAYLVDKGFARRTGKDADTTAKGKVAADKAKDDK